MIHITLYPANEKSQAFETENYGLTDGVLSFRVAGNPISGNPEATEIKTTVPFLIRQQAAKKESTTAPTSRTGSSVGL
jgi:hypothetical protein